MPGPLDPGFAKRLAPAKTNEDLFYLCKHESGFLDPDAFNEIRHRGLLQDFEDWITANTTRTEQGIRCRTGRHLWRGESDAVRCCDGIHSRAYDPSKRVHYWLRDEPSTDLRR
jgi:hypothetical protein